MANVRLPLWRQLEEFDVVPLHSVDHHYNDNNNFLNATWKCQHLKEKLGIPLSREWWVLAWQTNRLMPSTTWLLLDSESFSLSDFFLPRRITIINKKEMKYPIRYNNSLKSLLFCFFSLRPKVIVNNEDESAEEDVAELLDGFTEGLLGKRWTTIQRKPALTVYLTLLGSGPAELFPSPPPDPPPPPPRDLETAWAMVAARPPIVVSPALDEAALPLSLAAAAAAMALAPDNQ